MTLTFAAIAALLLVVIVLQARRIGRLNRTLQAERKAAGEESRANQSELRIADAEVRRLNGIVEGYLRGEAS